ncbi:MAG: nucleotidyltransferase family protein [Bacteroidales bacterium]|nr:nucleotidyltransferase family protein [Bacteroidales bacterium]
MTESMNLRTEELLLCGLCRLSFSSGQIKKLKNLIDNTNDWDYFLSLTHNHGVSALVYHNSGRLGLADHIPPPVTGHLRNSYMMNLARNSGFMVKMTRVLNLLNNRNIKTVLLKGLALELSVYGNSGLRQMTDVDILVSPENALAARQILIENGFVSKPLKSVLYKPLLTCSGKHLPGLSGEGLSVDIHNDLFGRKKSFLTRIFYDESTETPVGGEKAYMPAPLMFFAYLVKHLWLHEMKNESQLRLYTDLVVLIEKHGGEILGPALTTLAEKAGINEIMASRLKPLRDILEIPFPAVINSFIDKWAAPESLDKFLFFLKSPKNNPPVNKTRLYRYHLNEIPGLHRKFLFVAGDLFPSPEFMKNRYGCTSRLEALLYYPLRLGKLWYLIG